MRMRASHIMIVMLPCLSLLSGCAGVGNELYDMTRPFSEPNAPPLDALNMQRVRGADVAVQPITPQAGDVWPGPVKPVPTLSQIQKHMNVPLQQEFQNEYGPASPPAGGGANHVPEGSKPHSNSTGGAQPIGQTLIGPHGPVGIITGPSEGRYQRVAPVNGEGGGLLIPSGTGGSATLVEPNGKTVIVQVPVR